MRKLDKLARKLYKKTYKEYSGARCKHCKNLKVIRMNLTNLKFCFKQCKLLKHISVVARYCKYYEDKNNDNF